MVDQESESETLDRILNDASEEPTKLSYALIKSITNNFSEEIGRGGFGVVYQGVLRSGKVAVKKLSVWQDFSDKQFLEEVNCLMKAKHNNIVRFLGYCADTQGELVTINGRYVMAEVRQRLLCFEYLPNGSLNRYLKEKSHGDEWQIRYQMIKGICHGLHYLHNERISHLDLNPENILLDAHMEPRITDFGLSRCFAEGQSRIFTKSIPGTWGYIAPEIINKGEISFKSDLFGLGIIIIKLLIGQDNYDSENWHISLHVGCPSVKTCIEIARTCVDVDQHNRPTTGEIIHQLDEMESMIQKVPPIIQESRDDPGSLVQQGIVLSSSNYNLGVTMEEQKRELAETDVGLTWKNSTLLDQHIQLFEYEDEWERFFFYALEATSKDATRRNDEKNFLEKIGFLFMVVVMVLPVPSSFKAKSTYEAVTNVWWMLLAMPVALHLIVRSISSVDASLGCYPSERLRRGNQYEGVQAVGKDSLVSLISPKMRMLLMKLLMNFLCWVVILAPFVPLLAQIHSGLHADS